MLKSAFSGIWVLFGEFWIVPLPFLATTHISRYLLEPTYLAKSTSLINTPTNVATLENDIEGAQKRVLQLHWICLL